MVDASVRAADYGVGYRKRRSEGSSVYPTFTTIAHTNHFGVGHNLIGRVSFDPVSSYHQLTRYVLYEWAVQFVLFLIRFDRAI